MCLFQSGKDIPPLVRMSLRGLQYLIIPLLSLSILCVGSIHLGLCPAQPKLPLWHVVAGASGLLIPLLYLTFDEIAPRLSQRCSSLSEALDNVVVFLLPAYIIFEVSWLVAGTVWTFGSDGVEDPIRCDHTVYVFSVVVMINFWIHLLTPLIFMLALCCNRFFPQCAYNAYGNLVTAATARCTRATRFAISILLAVPLGASMIITGIASTESCLVFNQANQTNQTSSIFLPGEDQVRIPAWLMVTGAVLLTSPAVYFVYDKCWKSGEADPVFQRGAKFLVISYLLCGLILSVVGFVWVFGAHLDSVCGAESFAYRFAVFALITMNIVMDVWICYKICVVLYWAFLSDD